MSSICGFLSISGHYTLRLNGRQHLFISRHDALGMAESTGALAVGADVEHDVVGPHGIARNSADSHQVIEAQVLAKTPGDEVIGAGSVAADADSAHHLLASGEK